MKPKRQLTFLLVIALSALAAVAQKQFTLEDLNFGGNNYRNMIPANRTLRWWGDALMRVNADTCWQVDKATGKEKVLFTREELNAWAGLDETKNLISSLTTI